MAELEATPRWREVLTDSSHELYRVAWWLFHGKQTLDFVKEEFEAARESLTGLLLEIIEEDFLFDAEAPGDGKVPMAALKLLGEWQVKEALPMMLEILEDSTTAEMRQLGIESISGLGEDALEPVLEWIEKDEANRAKGAELLSRIGQNNDQAFEKVLTWLDPELSGMEYYARYLVKINPEKALPIMEAHAENTEFDKAVRERFQDRIQEAKELIEEREAEQKDAETDTPEETSAS